MEAKQKEENVEQNEGNVEEADGEIYIEDRWDGDTLGGHLENLLFDLGIADSAKESLYIKKVGNHLEIGKAEITMIK